MQGRTPAGRRAGQGRAGQSRQSKTGQGRAKQDRAKHDWTVQGWDGHMAVYTASHKGPGPNLQARLCCAAKCSTITSTCSTN